MGQKSTRIISNERRATPALRGSNSWLVSPSIAAAATAEAGKILYNRSKPTRALWHGTDRRARKERLYMYGVIFRADISWRARASASEPTFQIRPCGYKSGQFDRPLYTLCWPTLCALAHTRVDCTRYVEKRICLSGIHRAWQVSISTKADYSVDSARFFIPPD